MEECPDCFKVLNPARRIAREMIQGFDRASYREVYRVAAAVI
jgi:hypothetical protein